MTPPAHAYALLTPGASVPAVSTTPDAAALDLLERIIIDSHRAANAAQHGDSETLHELLATRGEMISALEALAAIVAPHIGPHRSRRAQSEGTRARLLAKSKELQELNVRLLQCVRAEAQRLSISIAALDRGDISEDAYRPSQAGRTSSLDLMR
jgi:hypothetical protein